MYPGDQVAIVSKPVSLTVRGRGNTLAVIVKQSGSDEFLVQLEGLPGKIGQRRVLSIDLKPSGQLRML